MTLLGFVAGLALLALVLVDSFEATVLPRRVTHRFRFTRFFYRNSWDLWRRLGQLLPAGKYRESFLSVFGPLSLLILFALWLTGLLIGFALLYWALGLRLQPPDNEEVTFGTYLYWSGTTLVTLGFGDVLPRSGLARALSVLECGLGLMFLAVIISYLPVLFQAFSRREVTISLLDARAGSPPSAAQMLLRPAQAGNLAALEPMLAEWERWAGELLESQLSFPVLSYYRSQHDNQSWLAALTTMLDSCTLLLTAIKDIHPYQAQLTFAMARHAAVDLALVVKAPPRWPQTDRLPEHQWEELQRQLQQAGLHLRQGGDVREKLDELRRMYEPFVQGLAERFLFTLPPILPAEVGADNWQRSAWMQRAPGLSQLPLVRVDEDHFA
jgi:hypothetical protein